ncbi:MAG: hypothetical protein IJC69_02635 [Clostridia bacterium]|nr:hypothetical protein [Clostridia bacterium]
MKNKVRLFLHTFFTIFLGMSLVNIVRCVIYGFSDGTILSRIIDLSYIYYALVSVVLTIILMIPTFRVK